MNPDIKKYLGNDTVYAKINKKFISLDPEDIRDTNKHFKKVFIVKILNRIIKNIIHIYIFFLCIIICMLQAYEELITIMKQQDSLFKETYRETVWTGSFYKKTKIELSDEFDLNLIIKLPIKVENIKVIIIYYLII